MKAVVQRVSEGSVIIEEENYQQNIGKGLVILLGIKDSDNNDDVIFLADKCSSLRIFNDEDDKMNLSVKDVDGEVLIISQFTIHGYTMKGNRPSYVKAAKPDIAVPLYEKFILRMKNNIGSEKIKTGIFGAMMKVKIVNDGPVTLIVQSKSESENS